MGILGRARRSASLAAWCQLANRCQPSTDQAGGLSPAGHIAASSAEGRRHRRRLGHEGDAPREDGGGGGGGHSRLASGHCLGVSPRGCQAGHRLGPLGRLGATRQGRALQGAGERAGMGKRKGREGEHRHVGSEGVQGGALFQKQRRQAPLLLNRVHCWLASAAGPGAVSWH